MFVTALLFLTYLPALYNGFCLRQSCFSSLYFLACSSSNLFCALKTEPHSPPLMKSLIGSGTPFCGGGCLVGPPANDLARQCLAIPFLAYFPSIFLYIFGRQSWFSSLYFFMCLSSMGSWALKPGTQRPLSM